MYACDYLENGIFERPPHGLCQRKECSLWMRIKS